MFELRNITENPGLSILRLGNAKLEESSLIIYYSFNLTNLIDEKNVLVKQYLELNNSINNNHNISNEMCNTNKILYYIVSQVEKKFAEIIPEQKQRTKRGSIN